MTLLQALLLSVCMVPPGDSSRKVKHYVYCVWVAAYPCQTYHHIIISGFGIYGAAVVPDSGVGNTWQRLTLVLHEFLSNRLTPYFP